MLFIVFIICITSYIYINTSLNTEIQIYNQVQFTSNQTLTSQDSRKIVHFITKEPECSMTAINASDYEPKKDREYNMVEVLYHQSGYGSNYYVKSFE